jgi:hypothetical protein
MGKEQIEKILVDYGVADTLADKLIEVFGGLRVTVNNLPDEPKRYVVARVIDGELWFWGSYEAEGKANRVAKEIDGVVVENGFM